MTFSDLTEEKDLLKRIDTEIVLQNKKTLELIKIGSGYSQYKPVNADDVDWKDCACHYEFRVDGKGNLQICFHCEHKFQYQLNFKKLVGHQNLKYYAQGNKTTIDFCRLPLTDENIVSNAAKAMLEFVEKNGSTIDGLIKESKGKSMNELLTDYVKLLENNCNIILHGAPGTGKTYLAKQIAKILVFPNKSVDEKLSEEEQKQFDEQCGFVQFHQSYDYTDFVEGLRPTSSENGKVDDFERKDGVFKEFCARALKSLAEKKDSISSHQNEILPMLNNEKKVISSEMEFERLYKEVYEDIKNGKKKIGIEGYESDVCINPRGYIGFGGDSRSESKDNIKLLYGYFCDENKWDEAFNNDRNGFWHPLISKLSNGKTQTIDYKYYQSMLLELNSRRNDQINSINSVEKQQVPTVVNSSNCYIFIIDEINRGEISKIFGELFFSIDSGYRGEKGRIKTQYQNLVKGNDVFADGFYVPKNVYIIGTMNDIDRSVESMDFAMRRRFAFKEIKADERIEMLDSLKCERKNEAVNCMKALNKKIESISGLSPAYHIGPAYFLKLDNYEGNFEDLWKYHIEGVLREYLRGMPKADVYLTELKDCYDKSVAVGKNVSKDNVSDSVENP